MPKQSRFENSGVSHIADHPDYQSVRFKGSGPPNGEGPMKTTLADIRLNVALLNGAAVIFVAAIGSGFLWMIDRIDDGFERNENKVSQVSKQIGDLRVNIATQTGDIKVLLAKSTTNQPNANTVSVGPDEIR